jgi:hypothetical protein
MRVPVAPFLAVTIGAGRADTAMALLDPFAPATATPGRADAARAPLAPFAAVNTADGRPDALSVLVEPFCAVAVTDGRALALIADENAGADVVSRGTNALRTLPAISARTSPRTATTCAGE